MSVTVEMATGMAVLIAPEQDRNGGQPWVSRSRATCASSSPLGGSQIRPSSNGLTIRCFRNDLLWTAGVRHRWLGWRRWPCRCPRRSAVPDGVRPLPHAGDQRRHGCPCGSRIGHDSSCGARPDAVRNRCYRRPRPLREAWSVSTGMATAAARAEPERSGHRHCRTLRKWPSGVPSRFRTPRTDCRVWCPPGECGG
jgi:hypothetical protein